MTIYRNGELGEAIGDTLNRIRDRATTTKERQLLVEYLRLLCELAVVKAEQGLLSSLDEFDG